MIVGTFEYLSPEQLEGHEADVRSDIWALGCVLYEMATGKRAFEGKTPASTIAAILAGEPRPIKAIEPMTPPALEWIVKTCLVKDRSLRIQSAHDVRLLLDRVLSSGSELEAQAATRSRGLRTWLPWAIASLALVTLTFALVWRARSVDDPPRSLRAHIVLAEDASLTPIQDPTVAISPDGRSIVYRASAAGRGVNLWLQRLDRDQPELLPDTRDGIFPFWSPDSREVGFFSGRWLKRLAVDGGAAQSICEFPNGAGGTWGHKGKILLGGWSGIYAVSPEGGHLETLTRATGRTSYRWPEFMPDGKHFVYLRAPPVVSRGTDSLMFAGPDMHRDKLLLREVSSAYFSGGFLVYEQGGDLLAQRFDPERGELKGEPTTIVRGVSFLANRKKAAFSTSANGTLVYSPGRSEFVVDWFDRSGKSSLAYSGPGYFGGISLAPDGNLLASGISDGTRQDIWSIDLRRKTTLRLTEGPGNKSLPVWSPDGKSIAYVSDEHGVRDLYLKQVDGSRPAELLLGSDEEKFPYSWTPDGRFFAYASYKINVGVIAIWILPMTGDRKPFPFLKSEFSFSGACFSPDGKWLAYHSDVSNRSEVYVTAFPGPGRRVQVSVEGGRAARWRSDGKELYFIAPDNTLMAAALRVTGSDFVAERPTPLFRIPVNDLLSQYDISRDSRFIAVSQPGAEGSKSLVVVTHCTAPSKP
jgi:Tol biopolymer transport system component